MKKKWIEPEMGFSHFKKIVLAMRLTFFLIVVTVLSSSAGSFGQKTKLDLNFKDRQIREILSQIEDQSDYSFMYDNNQVDVLKKVSLDAKALSIEEILTELFRGTNVTYKIIDRHIMLFPSVSENAGQQKRTIKGKVITVTGDPIPGASIVVKETTNGTITNMDGDYTLQNVPQNATLLFSFVGMKTVEISSEDKLVVNVTMSEVAIGIEEVVAVGYGTQKKVNLTGAVGAINSEELAERPVQNASQILQGLVPGLNISQSQGGSLNGRPDINIRGLGTIGEGSTGSPLILIDGIEGDINALNPQDIDNVSVLKDAAASSIYGSRAPFGVILITTKQGVKGKTTINYNNSARWSKPISMPSMMDSYTFALYVNDARINNGETGYFSEERIQRIIDFQNGDISYGTVEDPRNTKIWGNGWRVGNDNIDWYDEFYRDYAFSQEHTISASGGSDKMQFYFSGNYLDQEGFLTYGQEEFNRYATTLKIDAELNSWLSVSVKNQFTREDYSEPTFLDNAFFQRIALHGWPTYSLNDPNGYTFSPWVVNLRDGGRDKTQNDWLYQQIKFKLEPIKNWRTHFEFNYRTRDNFRHFDRQYTYMHDVAGNPYYENSTSEVYEYAMRQNFMTTNIYTEYEKQLETGHNFKGLIGFQAEDSKYRKLSAQRNGIIVPLLPVINLTSGTDSKGNAVTPSVSGYTDSWSTAGFFGRLNYNYQGRYLLEANLRYDGTSRFRKDMRWNWFPSVSAGWNIAKEGFWQTIGNKISTMKLRASYGELGNQNTSNIYPTYLTMGVYASSGQWLINGAKSNTSVAPGLISQSMTWEKIHSWNVGLDMALFDNRLNTSFDYFNRKTLDMIGPAPELPEILGTDVPKTNNTDLKTYGFELSLSWKDRLDNGLGYSVQFLLSDSQTEITRYPNETGNLSTYRKGMKMGEIWGYETIGIAKSQDEMDSHLASLPNGGQNAVGSQWEAGDIMYKDLNDDGKIDSGAETEGNHGDWKIIGNSTPRYQFALDLTANWKGFDIRALFQGVMKRDYFQNSNYFWGAYHWGIWWSTGLDQHLDYFRDESAASYSVLGENLDAYYPRPSYSDKNHKNQTRYLQDASYIRLKNLQVGYTLPKSIYQKFGLSKLRLFVSGENLWTGTKMTTIFDPESVEAGALGNNGIGYGGSTYPIPKVFSIGLNVNF